MASVKKALARESADSWSALLAFELGHTPNAESGWRRLNLTYADVLHVLEEGLVLPTSQEKAHEKIYQITGKAIDGEDVWVTVSINPMENELTVTHVLAFTEQDNDKPNDRENSA